MAEAIASSTRLDTLKRVAIGIAVVVAVRIFCLILLEYRWYFPADFDSSAFLSGRRYTFHGTYRLGFYVHIISGPLTLLMATFLILSGSRRHFANIHRVVGKLQLVAILGAMLPSGLVMAREAYGGPVAILGFSALTFATAFSTLMAARRAMLGEFRAHQRWAIRTFILLGSPLLFRSISGAAIVMEADSPTLYQLNAWASWLIPLLVYEWSSGSGIDPLKRFAVRSTEAQAVER